MLCPKASPLDFALCQGQAFQLFCSFISLLVTDIILDTERINKPNIDSINHNQEGNITPSTHIHILFITHRKLKCMPAFGGSKGTDMRIVPQAIFGFILVP